MPTVDRPFNMYIQVTYCNRPPRGPAPPLSAMQNGALGTQHTQSHSRPPPLPGLKNAHRPYPNTLPAHAHSGTVPDDATQTPPSPLIHRGLHAQTHAQEGYKALGPPSTLEDLRPEHPSQRRLAARGGAAIKLQTGNLCPDTQSDSRRPSLKGPRRCTPLHPRAQRAHTCTPRRTADPIDACATHSPGALTTEDLEYGVGIGGGGGARKRPAFRAGHWGSVHDDLRKLAFIKRLLQVSLNVKLVTHVPSPKTWLRFFALSRKA